MLTVKRLREVLDYDRKTGVFRWKVALSRSVPVGSVAGRVGVYGYRNIKIDLASYRAPRLAWLYVTGKWPKWQIDHRNCVKDDNRFSNLRDVSGSENSQNQRHAQSRSKTSLLGSSPYKGKFRATIFVHGKQLYLGAFPTAEAAHAAYVKAKREHHPGGLL